MARKKKSLSEAVSAEIQSNFNLDAFKEKKGLKQNIKFKDQEWIPLSQAFQDVTSIPGIPMGHICLLYTSPSPRDRQKSRMPSSA